MAEAAPSSGGSFEEKFEAFSTFGEREKGNTGTITLKNIDKWIKDAGLTKKFTTTDTGIAFSKVVKTEKRMNIAHFTQFLQVLCDSKGMTLDEAKNKLTAVPTPGLTGVTTACTGAAADSMNRLTDVSGYTGSHKERFDESGQGKGLAGRADIADNTGYVQGYKEKDKYDDTHKSE